MCVPGCTEAVHALSRRRLFAGAAAGIAATAATPARASAFTRVIDLTHTLSPDFPTFFGTPGIAIEKRYEIRRNGANVNWWHVLEHAGTHIDAPIHYSETGVSVERIPAEQLVVPLAVIDVAAKAARNADYALNTQDLLDWETQHGRLPDGCCVAMNSGWAQHAARGAKYASKDSAGVLHFPGVHPDAARFLLGERNVAGLAVDTLSLDPGRSRDFATHKAWLPAGRWGIENLANLDAVPAAGATLVVGAPKVKGASGAPARVLALV